MTHPDCGDPEAIHVLQVGLTAANRPVGDPDWPHRKALLAMLATVPDEVLTEASLSRVSRGKLAELMAADEAVSICQAERDSLRSELAAAQKERDELLARVECGMTSEQYEKARKELWGQAKRLGRELDDERAKVAAMRLDIEDLQTRYAERAEPRGDAGPGGLRPDEVCAGIARRLADVLAGTHERRVQSAPSSPPDPDPDCAECSGSGQIVPGATCAPCGGSGKPDPKPTGAPARDAQLHGGTCWLIEDKRGVYRGTWWFSRRSWEDDETVSWTTNASCALAFPTRAEAILFAREYLPELEGKVEVTEHGFTSGAKDEAAWRTVGVDAGTDMGDAFAYATGMPRVGRKQARNVYIGDDYVGVAFREQDARLIVTALTQYTLNTQPDPDAVRRETAREILAAFPKCQHCDNAATRHLRGAPTWLVCERCDKSEPRFESKRLPWSDALEAAEAAAGGDS